MANYFDKWERETFAGVEPGRTVMRAHMTKMTSQSPEAGWQISEAMVPVYTEPGVAAPLAHK